MLRVQFSAFGLVLLLGLTNQAYAQKKSLNGFHISKTGSPAGPKDDEDTPIGIKRLKFGVGLGPSINLQPTYSYTLLAPNYALSKESYSRLAGVVSGVVIYNKTVFYQKDTTTEPYASTYPLSALLAVNLASYATNANAAATGFNTRLDLGLGLGVRIDDNFQLGLFLDLANQRFLREAYEQYLGNPVPDYKPAQNLTALDITDDHYFISRTVPSISFKLIYTITANEPTKKEEQSGTLYLEKKQRLAAEAAPAVVPPVPAHAPVVPAAAPH